MVRRGKQSVQQKGSSAFWRAQDFHLEYTWLDTLFAITTILVCTLVAAAYQLDMARAFMAVVFSIFMIGALAIRNWMLGEKEERIEEIRSLEGYRWMNVISWGLMGFIFIVFAQFAVLTSLSFDYLATMDLFGRAFGYVAAVAETWFFQGLLLYWLIKMTGEFVISTLLCSGIFTVFHYTVYVILLGVPEALAAVFVSSLVLCAVCIMSRSLTAPTIAHGMINVGLRVMI